MPRQLKQRINETDPTEVSLDEFNGRRQFVTKTKIISIFS